jgi:predicted nuclease of predicted toxin-antitoxin system
MAALRFLADASCDFNIVKALRKTGFQVDAVAEIAPSASDETVIEMATKGQRILITEDKDFGRLVYASGHETVGILLLRCNASSRRRLLHELVQFIQRNTEDLLGAFVVAQPGKFRIRRLFNPQRLDEGPDKG